MTVKERKAQEEKRNKQIQKLLCRDFPKVFTKKPRPKFPLKIGIFDDLAEWREKNGIGDKELSIALRDWCRGVRYEEAMRLGKRYDLEGNEAPVDKEVQEEIDKRMQKKISSGKLVCVYGIWYKKGKEYCRRSKKNPLLPGQKPKEKPKKKTAVNKKETVKKEEQTTPAIQKPRIISRASNKPIPNHLRNQQPQRNQHQQNKPNKFR